MPEMELPAMPAVVPTVLPPVLPAAELVLGCVFLERLEDERCRLEGIGWLAPDVMLLAV